MLHYDVYVENYFLTLFHKPIGFMIPRDLSSEQYIIKANKIEYCMYHDVYTQSMIFFKQMTGSLPNGSKFEIELSQTNSFKKVKYFKSNEKFNPNQKNNAYTEKRAHGEVISELPGLDNYIKTDRGILTNQLSLFDLYCRLKHHNFENAVDELIPNISWDKVEACPTNHPWRRNRSLPSVHVCSFKEGDFCDFCVLFVVFNNYKHVLPAFIPQGHSRYFNFPPKTNETPFFNINCPREAYNPIIILTDSIELADMNQTILFRERYSDIVWLSWYGDEPAISSLNWDLLSKYTQVYYLVTDHSGFDRQMALKVADAIIEAMKAVGIKLRLITYYPEGVATFAAKVPDKIIPAVYSVEEFYEAMYREPTNIKSSNLYNGTLSLASGRNLLMAPFLYQRSVTLILGSELSGKTFFATYITLAIACGLAPFKGWDLEHGACPIYYFHRDSLGYDSFYEKCSILRKVLKQDSKDSILLRNFKYYNLYKSRITEIVQLKEYINSVVNEDTLPNKIIVLDNVFDATATNMTVLNYFINEMKIENKTIIVVANRDNLAKVNVQKRLQFATLVKIKKLSQKNGKLTMNICVDNSWIKTLNFRCVLDSPGHQPKFGKERKPFKRTHYTNEQREGLKKQILERVTKSSSTDIINDLNIGMPMFKKLKTELVEEGKINLEKCRKKGLR